MADVVRAVEGPVADVRDEPPDLDHPGEDGQVLRTLWIATRANLRSVLEHVTLPTWPRERCPPASTP